MTTPAPQGRTDAIIAASRRKAATAEKAARAALTKPRRTGTPITIAAVAREAGVSQHYLHQHPDLGPLIRSLRTTATTGVKPPPVDPTQSGLVSVLKARIDAHSEERRRLLAEISNLHAELEKVRGALAAANNHMA